MDPCLFFCAPRNNPAAGMRAWTDKQVASHAAFVPSILVAVLGRQPVFLEPLVFVVPLLVLSTLYHRHHEPHGTVLARTELAAAFALYFYGWRQLLASTSVASLLVCGACCMATSLTYVLTNLGRLDWDRWHYVGMHLVPGAWALCVSAWHAPVLF